MCVIPSAPQTSPPVCSPWREDPVRSTMSKISRFLRASNDNNNERRIPCSACGLCHDLFPPACLLCRGESVVAKREREDPGANEYSSMYFASPGARHRRVLMTGNPNSRTLMKRVRAMPMTWKVEFLLPICEIPPCPQFCHRTSGELGQ